MKKENMIAIILVIIAIIVISYIYYDLYIKNINEYEYDLTEIDVLHRFDGENILLENQGGDELGFDDIDLIITIENDTSKLNSTDFEVLNDNGDVFWDKGEIITFYIGNVTDKYFNYQLWDWKSKSLVWHGSLKDGKLVNETMITF